MNAERPRKTASGWIHQKSRREVSPNLRWTVRGYTNGKHTCPRAVNASEGDLFARLRWFERRFRWTGEHLARRCEARAVARTVPRALGVVPFHFASHVGADRRQLRHTSVLVAKHGDAFAVELDDPPFAATDRSQRLRVGTQESIAQHVVRIVDVLLQVIPRAADDLLPSWIEQLAPGVLAPFDPVPGHHPRERAECHAVARVAGRHELPFRRLSDKRQSV